MQPNLRNRLIDAEGSHRIGVVSSVDSERIVIELDPTTTGLVKAGMSGIVPVGTINSYITVPAGPHRIVAVITAIRMTEDADRPADAGHLEARSRRVVQAVMVGRLEAGKFTAGITTYPSVFTAVSSATPSEIARIFAPPAGPAFMLGEAVVAPDEDVVLDANKFLARHSAILGSTGAGKTCSVVAVIDGLLALKVPQANIVIFDANGEYAAAFAPDTERGKLANACLIGPEPGDGGGFFVPHWFMDNEDHLALFRASEGAQAPLLQRAIADARLGADVDRGRLTQLRNVTRTIQDIRDLANHQTKKPQEVLRGSLRSLASSLEAFQAEAKRGGDAGLEALWAGMVPVAKQWEKLNLVSGNEAWDLPVELEQRNQLDRMLDSLAAKARAEFDSLGLGSQDVASDFDAPRYYSMEALYNQFLPDRIEREAAGEPRIRGYAATMLMRLSRLLADSRYNFMTRVPNYDDAMARFIRYVLGRDPSYGWSEGSEPPWAESYRRRGGHGGNHSVTIIDLSLVASDVLENVTGLLGRLLLAFAQRLEPRGSLPMLLVLEEAHRYVPDHRTEQASRSANAFERIAKEGRKFGVSLMVASQRPSELSRTVLSQCGTLIAHRVVNSDDQELIRHATPFASQDLLRQLSGLAIQHAIVLGEASQVPAYVRVRDVRDAPRGSDPDFIGHWRSDPSVSGEVIETTSRRWEQSPTAPPQSVEAAEKAKPGRD